MVGEACFPSNAYYPRTPDYTFYSGVHVCWSEHSHSDSSFVYGFMSLDYGLGTMTATTFFYCCDLENRSRSPNPISSLLFPNNISIKIWLEYNHWFTRYCAAKKVHADANADVYGIRTKDNMSSYSFPLGDGT